MSYLVKSFRKKIEISSIILVSGFKFIKSLCLQTINTEIYASTKVFSICVLFTSKIVFIQDYRFSIVHTSIPQDLSGKCLPE